MRLTTILPAIAALFMAQTAQADSVFQQYQQARGTFLGTTTIENYAVAMSQQILDGLEGRWFFVGASDPKESDLAQFGEYCRQAGVTITLTSTIGFSLRRTETKDIVSLYTWHRGNSFSIYTDPTPAFVKSQKISSAVGGSVLKNIIERGNGMAAIFRPSPDILIINTNQTVPELYARCPV